MFNCYYLRKYKFNHVHNDVLIEHNANKRIINAHSRAYNSENKKQWY